MLIYIGIIMLFTSLYALYLFFNKSKNKKITLKPKKNIPNIKKIVNNEKPYLGEALKNFVYSGSNFDDYQKVKYKTITDEMLITVFDDDTRIIVTGYRFKEGVEKGILKKQEGETK